MARLKVDQDHLLVRKVLLVELQKPRDQIVASRHFALRLEHLVRADLLEHAVATSVHDPQVVVPRHIHGQLIKTTVVLRLDTFKKLGQIGSYLAIRHDVLVELVFVTLMVHVVAAQVDHLVDKTTSSDLKKKFERD